VTTGNTATIILFQKPYEKLVSEHSERICGQLHIKPTLSCLQNCSKSKAVPQHTMQMQGEEEVYILLIHDLGTRWGEWSASRPGCTLPPGKGHPGTNWTGGWVGPRAGLNTRG
jgi:hypothetical protein